MARDGGRSENLLERGRGQLGHEVSYLLGLKKQGFESEINCSQMKLLSLVN